MAETAGYSREQLRARQWVTFDGDTAREAKKAILPCDVKKREKPTSRDSVVEAFKRASYFVSQGHWLLSRFPDGEYANVSGLCKVVNRADIAANDYSLTPGRYVGVAVSLQDDDEEAFICRMKEIHSELTELNEKAVSLALSIQTAFEEMFE